MNKNKISIVVPVYNVELYLCECVESLLNQTIMPLEIILVDDGSTDNSGTMCDKYAEQYGLIKVIHKKNAGLGYARNTGIENVNSDYVTFVDSDDYCDPDYIETFVKILEKEKCDTCKTSYRRVNDIREILSTNNVAPDRFIKDDVKKQLLPRIIGSNPDTHDAIPLSACATLFSMEIINANNLRFPSEREFISEDTIFNIYYYSLAQKVVLSDKITYNYRRNNNSLTTRYIPDRLDKCKKMYAKEIEILFEKGIYDICKYRVTKQFFNYLRMCFAQLNKEICKLDAKEIKLQISDICKDKDVISIIDNYPVEKLGFLAKAFLKLVRGNHLNIIYIIYNSDLFKGIRV